MTARRIASVYALTLVTVAVAAGALFVATADLPRPEALAFPSPALELLDRLQFLAIGLLGAFLFVRRPNNRFVWVLLVAGAGFPLWDAADTYARWRLQTGRPWDGMTAAWLTNWLWALTYPLSGLFFLLFPSGSPPSRRWRPILWLSLAGMAATVLVASTYPGPLEAFPAVTNPLGLPVADGTLEPVFHGLMVLTLLTLVGGVISLVVRLVRSRGEERQQIKWLASAGVLFVALELTGVLELGSDATRAVLEVGVSVLLTAAIGVAITRYRLYDIDRVISRTLAYIAVIAILAGVYLGLVVSLGAAARALTGESGDIVVALSTLAVAAAFQPIRHRVRSTIDRRFNRSRYDAARTLDVYGRTLRDEVDGSTIVNGLRTTTAATFGAAHVGVWTVPPGSPA